LDPPKQSPEQVVAAPERVRLAATVVACTAACGSAWLLGDSWAAFAVALTSAVFAALAAAPHVGPRPRRALEIGLLGALGLLVAKLFLNVRWKLHNPPEWDFYGFWVHASSAVRGADFYDPKSAHEAARTLVVSDAFRREILDVGFWYPPPTMFLFAPLGWFELDRALLFWYGVEVGALALTAFLLSRTFFPNGRLLEFVASGALLVAAPGTWSTFGYAQTTLIALLAFLAFHRARDRLSGGVWLCAGVFVKPFLALLLVYPLVLGRFRIIATVAAVAIALFLLAAVAFGTNVVEHYFSSLQLGDKPDWIYFEQTNQSLLGALLRVSGTRCGGVACLTEGWFPLVAAVLCAITLVLVRRVVAYDGELAVALLLLLALMVYPVSQVFYSVFLTPVVLFVWTRREALGLSAAFVATLATALSWMTGYDGGVVLTWGAYLLAWGVLVFAAWRRSSGASPQSASRLVP